MKKKYLIVILIFIFSIFLLSGCIPGDGSYSNNDPAGFFSGVWHGWISPISLIIGIFNHDIHIYEPINTGWFYDFGFYIAIISGFGGISLSRKNRKSRD